MADKIRNIGPLSMRWLKTTGLADLELLREQGPIQAFLRVERAGFRPSLNLLWSIVGALNDCHWTKLSEDERARLLIELDSAREALRKP